MPWFCKISFIATALISLPWPIEARAQNDEGSYRPYRVLGHEGHQHRTGHACIEGPCESQLPMPEPTALNPGDEVQQSGELQVRQVLGAFHQAFEGPLHTHGIRQALGQLRTREGLMNWAQSFNLVRIGESAYRIYHIQSANPDFREHVANLAFLFPLSHGIEMLSGPLMASASLYMGWPEAVTGGLASVGAIISVPGLDPICILLFAAYPMKPVQRGVSFLRGQALKLAGGVAGILQKARSRQQRGANEPWAVSLVEITTNAVTFFTDEQAKDEWLKLERFQDSPGYFTSAQLHLATWQSLSGQARQAYLKVVPWNIRRALEAAISVHQYQSPKPFYLAQVDEHEGVLNIKWLERSVIGCDRLLAR